MKKLLLVCALATLGLSQSYAQLDEDDFGFFDHVSAGISLGTDGIGIEVAAPLTYNFAVRAGYSYRFALNSALQDLLGRHVFSFGVGFAF